MFHEARIGRRIYAGSHFRQTRWPVTGSRPHFTHRCVSAGDVELFSIEVMAYFPANSGNFRAALLIAAWNSFAVAFFLAFFFFGVGMTISC